jgi:hypothetical protein
LRSGVIVRNPQPISNQISYSPIKLIGPIILILMFGSFFYGMYRWEDYKQRPKQVVNHVITPTPNAQSSQPATSVRQPTPPLDLDLLKSACAVSKLKVNSLLHTSQMSSDISISHDCAVKRQKAEVNITVKHCLYPFSNH